METRKYIIDNLNVIRLIILILLRLQILTVDRSKHVFFRQCLFLIVNKDLKEQHQLPQFIKQVVKEFLHIRLSDTFCNEKRPQTRFEHLVYCTLQRCLKDLNIYSAGARVNQNFDSSKIYFIHLFKNKQIFHFESSL